MAEPTKPVKAMRVELCEWWPGGQQAATGRPGEQCQNAATLSVGTTKNWHLCGDCAALPEFKSLRKRVSLRRNGTKPRPWTVEDSLAATALAKSGVPVTAEVALPSGRRLSADEANALIERYKKEH
jgi:hypothetical protein